MFVTTAVSARRDGRARIAMSNGTSVRTILVSTAHVTTLRMAIIVLVRMDMVDANAKSIWTCVETILAIMVQLVKPSIRLLRRGHSNAIVLSTTRVQHVRTENPRVPFLRVATTDSASPNRMRSSVTVMKDTKGQGARQK